VEPWRSLLLSLVRVFYGVFILPGEMISNFIRFPNLVGALHSTSQIAGLLSWLCDLIRVIMSEQDDDESLEKVIAFALYLNVSKHNVNTLKKK
jgi:hypothetical protein